MLGTKGNWEGASHVGNTPEVEQLAPENGLKPKRKGSSSSPIISSDLFNFLGV